MAVYNNSNAASAILSVEFTPVSDGNLTFVQTPIGKKEEIKKWLASAEVGQDIIAETKVNGQWALVTHGDKSQKELLELLQKRGEKLELVHHKQPFNAWAARGALSMVGQTLQLSSGALRPGGLDTAKIVFAVANLAANISNMVFGAEKHEDINRLHFLKNHFNHKLGEYIPGGKTLPFNSDRAELHLDPLPPKTAGDKAWDFMQRNSVRFGEIGLRFFGAFALAFPLKKAPWKKALGKLQAQEFAEAYKAVRNPSTFTYAAGISYLGGKTLALFSKVPDPYDSKPHTWVDTLREKYIFRTSSIIEGVAAASLAYNGFAREKIQFRGGKKEYPDFLGGTGGLLFATAFIIRYKAKFGVKQLDMDEVYAHATDTLAKVPPEKLPQLMAESAALLKENMKDEPVDFGQIFTQMMSDLYRYHHIALDNLGTEPQERLAEMQQSSRKKPVPRRLSERVPAPSSSYAEQVSVPAENEIGIA